MPGTFQPPAVDDVADKTDMRGLVMRQEVDDECVLGSHRTRIDVGQ